MLRFIRWWDDTVLHFQNGIKYFFDEDKSYMRYQDITKRFYACMCTLITDF